MSAQPISKLAALEAVAELFLKIQHWSKEFIIKDDNIHIKQGLTV